MVFLSHYAAAWKEEGGEEEEEPAEAAAMAAAASLPSVSEALIRLYFHLENCELCVDGSELYMNQLSGLVEESQKTRTYAYQCLILVEKSASDHGARGRRKGRGNLAAAFATKEGRRQERQKRMGSFGDQPLLELLYQQDFAEFLVGFRNEVVRDYEAITAFTADPEYGEGFRFDCMEVVANTLAHAVPPLVDFLTVKVQVSRLFHSQDPSLSPPHTHTSLIR